MNLDYARYWAFRARSRFRDHSKTDATKGLFASLDSLSVDNLNVAEKAEAKVFTKYSFWATHKTALEVHEILHEQILSYTDFLVDLPYIFDEVKRQQPLGITEATVIAKDIAMTLSEERIGLETDPFDWPRNIRVPLFMLLEANRLLIKYSRLALENDYLLNSRDVLGYANDLSILMSEGTTEQEDGEYAFGVRPGFQEILAPQPFLSVLARIFESATRYLERGMWGEADLDDELRELYIKLFNHASEALRTLNKEQGENGAPSLYS